MPLLDIKDLRAVIQHLTSDEGKAELRGHRRGLAASALGREIIRGLFGTRRRR